MPAFALPSGGCAVHPLADCPLIQLPLFEYRLYFVHRTTPLWFVFSSISILPLLCGFHSAISLGALIGLGIGQIAHNLAPEVVPIPAVFAVVGMAAYFTAIVRAPLTGIMLIVEMTGNYSQMLPLLVSCFCAYAVVELLKDLPIYEALLERDLIRGGDISPLKEPIVEELIIHEGAPFAGLEVRSLGLPSGVILVRCSDGKRDWVPKANTRLEAHMRITALIAPDASKGLELFRYGCNGSSGMGKE